jgi:subtilisin-like proprotein convertase family protein
VGNSTSSILKLRGGKISLKNMKFKVLIHSFNRDMSPLITEHVEVEFTSNHTAPGDLQITLRSPFGTHATLMRVLITI